MNKGFTLIEILISLLILSIILLISSNILSTSLISQDISNKKLEEIKEMTLASTILRRDLRQAVNVPSRDFFGSFEEGTFIANYNNKSISFNTFINDISIDSSPVKKVLYYFDENILYRRQYFASNPYLVDDYFQSKLIKNISDVNFSFMYERRWHNSWPVGEISSKKIPTLIRVDFKKNNHEYHWIIEPNIKYAYQQ